MNRIPFVFLMSAVLVMAACSKKQDISDDNIPLDYFAWKVDGQAREVRGVNAYAFELSDDIGVYGWTTTIGLEGCYILIPNATAPGSHPIGQSPGVRGFYTDETGKAFSTHLGGSGTLHMESRDGNHVKGTFQFTARDGATPAGEVAITEGRFHVRFR